MPPRSTVGVEGKMRSNRAIVGPMESGCKRMQQVETPVMCSSFDASGKECMDEFRGLGDGRLLQPMQGGFKWWFYSLCYGKC